MEPRHGLLRIEAQVGHHHPLLGLSELGPVVRAQLFFVGVAAMRGEQGVQPLHHLQVWAVLK